MALVNAPEFIPDVSRIRRFMVIVGFGLIAIIARLWYLQIRRGDEFLTASEINRTRTIRRLAPRGIIEDRNGKILATNRRKIVVSVVPAELKKNPKSLQILATLLSTTEEDLADSIEQNRIGPYDPVHVVVDIDLATATRIEERRPDLPGIIVEPEPVRYYPDGALFGHVLGQMGQVSGLELQDSRNIGYKPGDFCGKLGIERAYDQPLRGKDGGREVEVDAHGRIRSELGAVDPTPGATLRLTIDKDLQRVAYDALSKYLADGKPGAAVALNPNTGAVLALASAPSYDPNQFVTGISGDNWAKLRNDPSNPLVHRAVSSAYAPGSTFKLITTAAGLETERVSPDTTEFCGGSISLGKWRKRCHKKGGHGTVDLNEAIARSCDVFFYHLGQRLGPERIAEYAHKFGLGKRTGIDILRDGDKQVERDGVVPTPEWKRTVHKTEWFGGETVDYAIGQAMLLATPLQMCNVAAGIANGGTLYRPKLVESITAFSSSGKPHVIQRLKPEPIQRIDVSPQTMARIVKGMKSVMEYGTGATSAIPSLAIAGKTGTAQMVHKGRMVDNAWFIGYAPVEKPRIAVCVFVQEGGHGGVTAAPIARQMFAQYFHIPLQATAESNATD